PPPPPLRTRGACKSSSSLSKPRRASFDGNACLACLRLALPLDLGTQPLFLCPKLRGELLAEILRLEDWADLDLRLLPRHRSRAAPDPLDGLLHRLHLPDPEARDELLGLGERPVDDRLLPAGEAHALALAAGVEAVARQHDAGLHQLLVELAHVRAELLARHDIGL